MSNIGTNMLQSGRGVGPAPARLDAIKRTKAQNHRWTFTGSVGAGIDQAAYYYLNSPDIAESGNTLGTPAFASSAFYTAAQATRYIADNSAPLTMAHFTRAAGSSSATLLAGTVLKFLRFVPDGDQQQEQIEASTYVSADRFDPTVLSIPIDGEVFDGYTFLRVNSPQATPVAAGYNLTFRFGPTLDRRAEVPGASGTVVKGTAG